MQQSINTSIQKNSKFDFFQKNKTEKSSQSVFIPLAIITFFVVVIFIAASFDEFIRASEYLKVAPINTVWSQTNTEKLINDLNVSLENKSSKDAYLKLGTLNSVYSIKNTIQSLDLLLKKPIHTENQKTYSSDYKVMVAAHLLTIGSDTPAEFIELSRGKFYKNSVLANFKKDLLVQKFNNDYLKTEQDIKKFNILYMKLVDNINNVELKAILHDHLLKLLESFDADLKKLKES